MKPQSISVSLTLVALSLASATVKPAAFQPARIPASVEVVFAFFENDREMRAQSCHFDLLEGSEVVRLLSTRGNVRTYKSSPSKQGVLVRCGDHVGFSSDPPHGLLENGGVVVFGVYTKLGLLDHGFRIPDSLEPENRLNTFMKYSDGRGALKTHWLKLPEPVRRVVKRGYALTIWPRPSVAHETVTTDTWFR